MVKRIISALTACAAVGVLALVAAQSSKAAPAMVRFTVNDFRDQTDYDPSDGTCETGHNNGMCTLRAAVMQANKIPAPGATIIVPSGTYTLTRPPTLSDGDDSGDLNLTTPSGDNPPIFIMGEGANTTFIDANQLGRIFRIEAGRNANISGLTLRNGYYTTRTGGGLYNEGTLTLVDITLADNHAQYGGGIDNNGFLYIFNSTIRHNTSSSAGAGLSNFGIVTLRNSTVTGNIAGNMGGGIYTTAGLTTVSNSTISGNQALLGGGIANMVSLMVGNSTLSANSATLDGGGIYNYTGSANVYNTSIVFNEADADVDFNGIGGGVYNGAGATLNVRNVLLAGNNVSDAPVFDDCRGTLARYGWNLIGTEAASVHCSLTGLGGSGYLNSLGLLGPLQNNGGPTWTHALLQGSNAIDGGDPVQGCIDQNAVPLTTDQRGAARPVGARCDMGAFEYRPPLYLPLIRR